MRPTSFVKGTGCLQRRHGGGGRLFFPSPCFPSLFHTHSEGSAQLSWSVGSGTQDRTCLSLTGHQQDWPSGETGLNQLPVPQLCPNPPWSVALTKHPVHRLG